MSGRTILSHSFTHCTLSVFVAQYRKYAYALWLLGHARDPQRGERHADFRTVKGTLQRFLRPTTQLGSTDTLFSSLSTQQQGVCIKIADWLIGETVRNALCSTTERRILTMPPSTCIARSAALNEWGRLKENRPDSKAPFAPHRPRLANEAPESYSCAREERRVGFAWQSPESASRSGCDAQLSSRAPS